MQRDPVKKCVYDGVCVHNIPRTAARRCGRAMSLSVPVFLLFAALCSAQVVINEIMYHPYAPWPTTNDTEYVELHNAGTSTVDLSGWRFDNGIDYSFPQGTQLTPGGFLVVCQDVSAFTNAYPSVTNCLASYQGRLDDGGERVTLSRQVLNDWVEVASIKYIDGGTPDGGNTSLELVHPGFGRLRNQYYGAWAASMAPAGTPGAQNSVYDPSPPPVVGDVEHDPPRPLAGSVITVSARAAAYDSDVLASVILDHRKDDVPQGSWSEAQMLDNGKNGDTAAGDGIYTVRVPVYGASAMAEGELLEFRVRATDSHAESVTVPAENTAGVLSGPYSYLCYFGDDPDYIGEYRTYHLLLTQVNRDDLETRGDWSDVLLDCTLITGDGRIFYNCGLRYRGSSSRGDLPYNYRVELPRGRREDGYRDMNLNHFRAILQHLGMTIMDRSGYGNFAPETELCRVWLNETHKTPDATQKIYARVGKIDDDLMRKHYDGPIGNIYRGNTYNGRLDYRPDIADYQNNDYIAQTNNPATVWHSLSNLCWYVQRPPAELPQVLTNRANIRQWARHFAVQSALENVENGLYSSRNTVGDDYFIYADGTDGIFDFVPWDMDSVIDPAITELDPNRSIWAWESNSGVAQPTVSNFLLNPPIVPYYAGDVLDVLETVMGSDQMAEILDECGSVLSPTYRQSLLDGAAQRRNAVRGQLNTNLTATISGALAQGTGWAVVDSSSVSLSGNAPQNYTARVHVNGAEANWSTRDGTWSTKSNVSLSGPVDVVLVEALCSTGGVLRAQPIEVVVMTSSQSKSGTISGNTTWDDSGGIVRVTDDVTVTSGAKLTIASDTVVLFNSGKKITVSSGMLDIQGTGAEPVLVYPYDGSSAWTIEASGSSASVTSRYAETTGGRFYAASGGTLTLEDSLVESYSGTDGIVAASSASLVTMRRCIVRDYAKTRFNDTPTEIDDCLFEQMTGCGVELVDSDATVKHSTMKDSVGTSDAVAGVRFLDHAGGTVSNCLVHDVSGAGVAVGVEEIASSYDQLTLIAKGATWKYLDNGSDQGTAWRGTNFNDSGWASGPAELGYGDGGEATVVSYGGDPNNKYITTYFRRSFTVTDVSVLTKLTLRLRRDDGAVVHLNGTEVRRDNLPGGSIDYLTQAISSLGGAGETNYYESVEPLSMLVTGQNVLAIEIHQCSPTSSDISFDLELNADRTTPNPPAYRGTNSVTLCHSLVYDCDDGMLVGGTDACTNYNNTIADCTVGLHGQASAVWQTHNTIVWANDASSVSNGPATVAYSDIAIEGTNAYAGTGNLNRDPWFRSVSEPDHRLAAISPCLGAGQAGADMGASFPVGACPAAPDSLLLTNVTDAQIDVRWQDNSANETRFEIERHEADTDWTVVGTAPTNATSFVDTNVLQNTLYTYRVRAAHARGRSLPSEQASRTTGYSTTTQLLVDNLRITEIMYNPSDSTDDAHEFVELKNIGDTTLNLAGLYFSAGIDFVFSNGMTLAAGDFFVIVKDPTAFATRYPAKSYHGVFQNGTGLDNGGETLRIKDAGGNTIFKVAYEDGNGEPNWYPSTDGDGYSLVLSDPDGDPDEPATWRASSNLHGSPDEDDPPAAYATIVINEVLAHTDPPREDAIELLNIGTNTVDVSGWYLSDNEDNVKKYQIPTAPAINIAPGGFHVFYEGTSFNNDTNDPACFEISSHGEKIYLSSASGTNLTSYRTWVKFGASENPVSFGRYVRSDGEVDFPSMSAHTFGMDSPSSLAEFRTGTGLSNAYPKVGPVVINEIMYNPAATGKEYVELYNASGGSVLLYDASNPSNTWLFDGAMEFTFPTNTSLAAGEHALVVSIEPAEFRGMFGLTNPALQVFGPFDGALANGGESVKLYKPDSPEDDGFVPYVLVERVKYDDELPWPVAADNGGPSLERIDAAAYGNDPTNWIAGSVGGSPGSANNTNATPTVTFLRATDEALETGSVVYVELLLSPAATDTVTVAYSVAGTATPGNDYVLAGGTLVFWPHDTSKTLALEILDDATENEPDETVTITITNVTGNARLGGKPVYTYTIVDTDTGAIPAPTITPPGTNTFASSIGVTITSTVPSAVVRYTTDGSVPTASSPVYTTQLTLTKTTKIRAKACVGSYNAGLVGTAWYVQEAAPPEDPMIAVSKSQIETYADPGENASNETFQVWNNGTGTLVYQLTDGAGWFSVSPTNETSTGAGDKETHTIVFSTSGLPEGRHEGSITVTDTNALNNPVTIPVAVQIGTPLEFTAYNDLAWTSGQLEHNITFLTRSQSGTLTDHATGMDTPVTLTINDGGSSTQPTQGANAQGSTDGYLTFNGIVDCTGLVSYGDPLTLTFSGLSAGHRYTAVVFGNRDVSGYTDRLTQIAISGADVFANESSAGADYSGVNDPSVVLVNGYNTLNGYVARFSGIDAGSDDTFVITVSDGGSVDPPRFYVNALMLKSVPTNTLPPNYTLTVNNGTGDGDYPSGAQVGVSADAPAPGYRFSAWTGDTAYVDDTNAAATTVTMPAQSVSITATYVEDAWESPNNSIPKEHAWKYDATGTDLGSAWRALGYNDGSWPFGPGTLGYGESYVNTTVPYGGDPDNKYITTYFRCPFTVTMDPAAVTEMTLSARYDDGFVAYLNGQEIARRSLGTGTITYSTMASSHEGTDYEDIDLAAHIDKLQAGDNVLAVEVHQVSTTSSDMVWDGGLTVRQGDQILWNAYNDLAWRSGQLSTRITLFTDGNSGQLVDYATGNGVGVTLTVGGYGRTRTRDGAAANTDTDAYRTFNGIVSCDGDIQPENGNLLLDFSGLNPTSFYNVVVFGNRDGPDWYDRLSAVTISSVDDFRNASTPGADFSGESDPSTVIANGYNTVNGYVARFSGIDPGSDGFFRLTVSDGGSPNPPAWYVNALMLQEVIPNPDTDGDGMDDTWEIAYFGSITNSNGGATEDWDLDGMRDIFEYKAGTDPTNELSLLQLQNTGWLSFGELIVRWQSVSSKSYAIDSTTNLLDGFNDTVESNLVGYPPENSYTVTVDQLDRSIYRIRLEE